MSLRSRPTEVRSSPSRSWIARLAGPVLVGSFVAAVPGHAFWDARPTRGLYKPTAYVLARGEVEIQFFAFASPTDPLGFLRFEYG